MKALLKFSKYWLLLALFTVSTIEVLAQCEAKRLENLFNSPGDMEYSRRGHGIPNYTFKISVAGASSSNVMILYGEEKDDFLKKVILNIEVITYSIFHQNDVVLIMATIEENKNIIATSYLFLAGQEIRFLTPISTKEGDFQAKPIGDNEVVLRFYDNASSSYYFGLYNRKSQQFCYGEKK